MKGVAGSTQQEFQAVGVSMVRQGVRSTSQGNSLPVFGPGEIVPGQLRRLLGGTIPGAVHAIGRKAVNIGDVLSQVEPTTSKNLPHSIRCGRTVGILLGMRTRAQGNRRAVYDACQLSAVDSTAQHRQLRGGILPARPAYVQTADRSNGSQYVMPVRVLSGTNKRGIAALPRERKTRRGVTVRVYSLRQEVHRGDACLTVEFQLSQIRNRHSVYQPAQGQHLAIRLRVEVPEYGIAPSQQASQCGLSQPNRMAGQNYKPGLELIDEVSDDRCGPPACVPGPKHHVHQPAVMAECTTRTDDRSLRLSRPARSQNGYAHRAMLIPPLVAGQRE